MVRLIQAEGTSFRCELGCNEAIQPVEHPVSRDSVTDGVAHGFVICICSSAHVPIANTVEASSVVPTLKLNSV